MRRRRRSPTRPPLRSLLPQRRRGQPHRVPLPARLQRPHLREAGPRRPLRQRQHRRGRPLPLPPGAVGTPLRSPRRGHRLPARGHGRGHRVLLPPGLRRAPVREARCHHRRHDHDHRSPYHQGHAEEHQEDHHHHHHRPYHRRLVALRLPGAPLGDLEAPPWRSVAPWTSTEAAPSPTPLALPFLPVPTPTTVLGGRWLWEKGGAGGVLTPPPRPTDPCLNGGHWTGTVCLCPPNVDGAHCQFGASTINITAGKAGWGCPRCPP